MFKRGVIFRFCLLKKGLMLTLSSHHQSAPTQPGIAAAWQVPSSWPSVAQWLDVLRLLPRFQLQTLMNFKLKDQPNLLSSISLIQYNLFLNSFSYAKASQSDSQQVTGSACKSGQFIPSCMTRCRLSCWLDHNQADLIIYKMASLRFVLENMPSEQGKWEQQQI